MPNIFHSLPDVSREEVFETVLTSPDVTIERIISFGQTTPRDQWLEDARNEWVVLLHGAAELVFWGGNCLSLKAGDHISIPAHTKHRVEWTDTTQPSIWLAVYYPAVTPACPPPMSDGFSA